MWLSLLGSAFPLILKIVGYFIEKMIKDADKKEKALKAFMEFVGQLEYSLEDSAKLRNSAKLQKERLKKLIK